VRTNEEREERTKDTYSSGRHTKRKDYNKFKVCRELGKFMEPVVNEKASEELKRKESKILSEPAASALLKEAPLNSIK
jgi:hypothetical protein